MLNCVNVIATLKEVDKNNPLIRYCSIKRPYFLTNEEVEDIIPVINWNKEPHGELFYYKKNSMVVIKGRIESYDNQVVIVSENVLLLGLKE